MRRRVLTAVGAAFLLSAATPAAEEQGNRAVPAAVAVARPPVVSARAIARYPHDSNAFTQGLFIRDGRLYETTGLEGRSSLREVDLTTGRVRRHVALPPNLFGEGSTDWGREIVSITWRSGVAFRWDRATFKRLGTFSYSGEGWGLTQDGRRLILSDGSPVLRFMDPRTFKQVGRITVTYAGRPLAQLNELEWVDGAIWANVWHQNALVRIDPANGRVTQVLDLAPLVAQVTVSDPEAVPNGIAWDAKARRFYVTGKKWPVLFQIELPKAP